MFLSSADWMPRNLLRRVEVLFPVDAPALREQMRREVIEPALADTAHAYDMHADGTYTRRVPSDGVPARGAQLEALERVLRRTQLEDPIGAAIMPTPESEPPEPQAAAD